MSKIVTIGNATLYHGDCREILPSLPKVDLVLTDPPYGIGADLSMYKTSGVVVGYGNRRIAKRVYEKTDWDAEPPSVVTINECIAHGNSAIVWGGNYFGLPATQCFLVWDKKTNGNFADCELAWTNLKKPVRRIEHLWNGFARAGNEERFDHPTQKPIPVMEWCLSHVPDAVSVADPFMGSGTTGVACANMGKTFYGIERERKYFDIACERIERAYAQQRLFA